MISERRTLARESNRVAVRVYESSKGWCCRWRSDRMPAPAFWYSDTEQEARNAAGVIQGTIDIKAVTRG